MLWSGAPRHQVNLGTAQHDSAGTSAPTIPRRRKHDLASVTRMRILLTKLGSEFYDTQVKKTDGRLSKIWESIAHSGYCTNPKCTSEYRQGRELRLCDGWVLPSGHMLCPACNDSWATFIVDRTQLSSLASCLKDDADCRCYTCAHAVSVM